MTDPDHEAREAFNASLVKGFFDLGDGRYFADIAVAQRIWLAAWNARSLTAAAALLRAAGWTVEEPMAQCKACGGTGTDGILHFWERPGGPPGNGYGMCPTCNGTGKRKDGGE